MKFLNWFKNFPVDIVYTYVNGDDENFLESAKYFEDKTKNLPQSSIAPNRYKNYGEFKYSLRSLEKFAPWIRNIYIFTSTKKPAWLDLGQKNIFLVEHRDVIPKKYLPLFNSQAIELFLGIIPCLAEHFIYFNDDCFLGNFMEKNDFFTEEGKCLMNMNKGVKKMELDPKNCWQVGTDNSFKAIKKKFGAEADFMIHQARPFLKSACRECVNVFSEEAESTKKSRFRDFSNFNFSNVIYPFYATLKNKGIFSLNLMDSQIFVPMADNLLENENFFANLMEKKPKLFCLNDETNHNNPKIERQIIYFLEKYFPEKSKFEN